MCQAARLAKSWGGESRLWTQGSRMGPSLSPFGCPYTLSPPVRQSKDPTWTLFCHGWGMALLNPGYTGGHPPAVWRRCPSADPSKITWSLLPASASPAVDLLSFTSTFPQFALKLVLVTARTSSVLRDFKIIFVERFLPPFKCGP